MKIKLFKIRLDDSLHQDEKKLNEFMETVSIKRTAAEFVTDKVNYWSVIIYYEDKLQKHDSIMSAPSEKISFPADTALDKEETAILSHLKLWRHDMSVKTSMPSYMICHNSELVTIAKIRPKRLEDFMKIKGFSSQKILKYGDDVLALLNSV